MFRKIYKAKQNKELKIKLLHYLIAVSYKFFNTFFFRIIFNTLSKNRRKVKDLGKKIQLIDEKFEKISNYYLPKKNSLNEISKFASFGIGSDISFEKEVYLKYGLSSYCFDPTPRSKKLIDKVKPSFINYFDIGLNRTSGNLTFYQIKPYSDFTLQKPKRYWSTFESSCWSFDDLSNNLDIEYFDLIKMDIEGAALPIVIDLCDRKNNFGILIAELELMSNSIDDFEKNINKLVYIVEKNFYQIYRMPKEKDNFTSIEVIILNSVRF